MNPLKINPTFRDLIPPLSDEEFLCLEENILSQGCCRDTIKVWRGKIIDGHNRYAICQKHGVPYETQELRFASMKDAELWIIQNQLGRRNITNAMRIKLVLHKEGLLRAKAKQNRKGNHGIPVHVRPIIAKEAGVSEQTVHKYMKVRELGTPELVRLVEAGVKTISEAHREVGLEVVTRTVETFHRGGKPSDASNPICRRAVLNNIDRIGGLFCFAVDYAPLFNDGEDIARIRRKLGAQSKVFGVLEA